MHIISQKRLRDFWQRPGNAEAESPLRSWFQAVKNARWQSPADVRATYRSADFVGNKVVFNIGGNKYRLIAVIDFEGHKVFLRHVLTHTEYDKGHWKKDPFGKGWQKRLACPPRGLPSSRPKGRGGRRRPRR